MLIAKFLSNIILFPVYRIPWHLKPDRSQNFYNCDYGNEPPAGKVCNFEVNNFGSPCSQENDYNYHRQSPCVFLMLDKIPGWTPEYYNASELPEKMPQDLQNHIKEMENFKHQQLSTIWVSCDGENPADQENVGRIAYYPRRGFPGYFFPYQDQEGYLSPLVAVHFERPACM
jgi:sodium/potassium-transporting ATPase subunit beta